MSSLFDDTVPPSTLKTDPVTSTTQFFSQNGILIVVVVILFFTIITLWLLGSKVGDTFLDGLKVPVGFPFFIVRNLFNTLALLILGIAIFYAIRTIADFDATVLIILFAIFCGTLISYEAMLELKKDLSGAALVSTLSITCLAFILFLSWKSAGWVKLLMFTAALWYIFLFFETLSLHYMNT